MLFNPSDRNEQRTLFNLRLLLGIAPVAIVVLGLLANYYDPQNYDPLVFRLIVAFISIAVLGGTFVNKNVLLNIHSITRFFFYVVILWHVFITYKNNFEFSYSLSLYALFFILCSGLKTYREIGFFILYSVVLISAAILGADKRPVSAALFISMVMFAGLVLFVIKRRVNLIEEE